MKNNELDIKIQNKIYMTIIGVVSFWYAYSQGVNFVGFLCLLLGLMLWGVAWLPDRVMGTKKNNVNSKESKK